MKNFKVFLAGAIAVLIAMPAFAGVNVKMKGDFREYFSVFNYFPEATGDTHKNKKDSDFRYAQRVRLSWIAEDDEKKVRGTFGIEVDTVAGQSAADGRTRNGPGGQFEGDATNIEIWLAYIDFELPFDPATRVYMGLQETEMNPLVFCDNAMGVRLVRGFGDVDVSLAWYRNDTDHSQRSSGMRGYGGEGKDYYDNLYALDVAWNISDANKLGFFVYFMDAGEDFGASLCSNDTIDPMWWGDGDTQTYWIGLSGAFEQGAFFGGFNGIYQGGKVKASDSNLEKRDINAWLANLELGVKFLERAYAKIGYLYMSGEKNLKGDINNFFGIDIDNTVTGSVALLENLDWNGAFYGPNIGWAGAQHLYVNVGYEFDEKNEGRIGFLWANADKKIEGERNIGYEFNAQWDHKLTKNLTWSFAGGYMIAGNGWDKLASNGEGDDLWRIESRLRFKF